MKFVDSFGDLDIARSLPSWERGLKFLASQSLITAVKSLPSWERGLKSVVEEKNEDGTGRSPRGSVD